MPLGHSQAIESLEQKDSYNSRTVPRRLELINPLAFNHEVSQSFLSLDYQVGRGGEADKSVGAAQLPDGRGGEEGRGGERREGQGGDGGGGGEDSDESQPRQDRAGGEEAQVGTVGRITRDYFADFPLNPNVL